MKIGSKLLLDEYPLMVLPQLAVKIGLNEAIILQQVNYWLLQCSKEKDGRLWIYNTYEDWQKQFPFFSLSTIRRTIAKLEKMGLLITGNYNKLKIDQTKWYTIDFDVLNSRYVQNEQACNSPTVQNEQTISSDCNDHLSKMNRPLPETSSKTTSKIKNDNASALPTDGINIVDNLTVESKEVYIYFMRSYLNNMGEAHPTVNKRIVDRLNNIMESGNIHDPDTDKELYIDVEAMQTMIDKYFDTDYQLPSGGHIDYRIYHFLSDGIMKNLYYKECY